MTIFPARSQALALAFATSVFALSTPASAQSSEPQFATFAPKANPIVHTIDYSIWDEAMKYLVISMGPSTRESAGRPEPGFGSRRQYGHVSRYRLEGTRVMFSFLDRNIINSFTEYRRDLEATADKLDIQSLSRNEQLAYWINLHNVAMMEQIGNAWPVRQPREIKIDGVPLDDAKFITVEGVKLSPKDIRTKIVFPNWKDPAVMYGFWHGDIGGPALQREAFNANNVAILLDRGAREFVNSLRGTQKLGKKLQVSEVYLEAAPFYFDDFAGDLRAHIEKYADPEVKDILTRTTKTEASITEYDIADLAGGVREPSYTNITSDGVSTSFRIPQSMARLLVQRQRKLDELIRDGKRTGTVTVGTIKLPGQENDGEVE